jgi:hypothetical protein
VNPAAHALHPAEGFDSRPRHASRPRVISMVVRQGLWLVLIGLALGLAAASSWCASSPAFSTV